MIVEICTGVAPALLTLTFCDTVGTWSVSEAKFSAAGDMESEAAAPVPLIGTVCGDPDALSENEIIALCTPVEFGVKAILTLHWLPAPIVPPLNGQFVPDAKANSGESVPTIEIVLT